MPNRKPLAELLKANNKGVSIDLGGGGRPQPGFVNVDYRDLPEVDVVHNLCVFPWPLPDACASLVMASHLLEHINPTCFDPRFGLLVELLVRKKLLTAKEVRATIGDTDSPPVFMRFMDEVHRILKPGGKFMFAVPYAGSTGYWQDPTHVNPISEVTLAYFDPQTSRDPTGVLWGIYRPRPWKIDNGFPVWHANGNLECVMSPRPVPPQDAR